MPPKKKKLTKAEKEAIKREEEEKRLQEEELARIQAEEEEKERLENERLEREERERIKAEEAEVREKEQRKLRDQLEKYTQISFENDKKKWEEMRWNHFLHKSNQPDPLILQEANAYLSQWEEDENYNIQDILQEIHRSLEMIKEIEFAVLYCPEIDNKTETSWRESRVNLQNLLSHKLDMATYSLLLDANEFVNRDTFNMEYSVTDTEEINCSENSHPTVSLCLWANLAKNPRYKGMEREEIGFSFELPRELLVQDCAVCMMHTLFDHITPTFPPPRTTPPVENLEEIQDSIEIKQEDQEDNIIPDEITNDIPNVQEPSQVEVDESAEVEKAEQTEGDVPSLLTVPSASRQAVNTSSSSVVVKTGSTTTMSVSVTVSPCTSETEVLPAKSSTSHISIKEPEIEIVDLTGYSVIGGIFHFQLLKLPPLPVKTGCWILTYVEEHKILEKLTYKAEIIPIRQPKPGMSPAEAAEFADAEIKRFESEMGNAISVALRLPKCVLFLEQPIPAFWVSDKNGWTTSGFFDIKYEEDKGRLFFKTNQFGTIGMLQRKYANLPFQSWELRLRNNSHNAIMSISGALVMLEIEIGEQGCRIQLIQQGDALMFTHLYTEWLSPRQLINLSTVGINISPEENAFAHIGTPQKDIWTEDWTYFCMSILCSAYTFSWSRWNSAASAEQLVMKCYEITNTDVAQNTGSLVLLTRERALYLKCTEINQTFSDEPVDGQLFFSDLYHLLINGASKDTLEKLEDSSPQFSFNEYAEGNIIQEHLSSSI